MDTFGKVGDKMKFIKFFTVAAAICFFCLQVSAQNTGENMEHQSRGYSSLEEVPPEIWQALAQKSIYFGHQSVGYNIMDGLQDLLKEYQQIKLRPVESYDPDSLGPGVFAHSRLGYNWDPESKTKAFSFLMKAGMGEKADIAFHKYCYVDMNPGTNVDQLFAGYQQEMEKISRQYPHVKLIHVTMPLTTVQAGFKAKIKSLLGKSPAGVEDNIKRNRFNEKLKQVFGKTGLIFDLAAVESTYPDGSKATFEKDGKQYPRLIEAYASDSGHLNEKGRRMAAEKLLLFLANHFSSDSDR